MTVSDAQLQRDVFTLRCAGFAVIPGFLEEEMVDRLFDLATEFEKEVEIFGKAGGEVIYQAGFPLKNVRALYAVATEFQDLIMDPRLQAYVQAYLGDGVLRDCHLLTNLPDEKNARRGVDGKVNWHRDTVGGQMKIEPNYLHCFHFMTDFTRENGGTLVVPGTHLTWEPGYYFVKTDPGEKVEGNYYPVYDRRYFPASTQVEAPKGSLLLIDPMMIHAQGINVTNKIRSVINATFHRRGLSGMMNCRTIAEKHGRVPVRADLVSLLEDDPELPGSYGPLS